MNFVIHNPLRFFFRSLGVCFSFQP